MGERVRQFLRRKAVKARQSPPGRKAGFRGLHRFLLEGRFFSLEAFFVFIPGQFRFRGLSHAFDAL